jgi:periodic tryptophan protein 1
MITATAWVPRGFAAPFPTRYAFDEEEFKRIADLAKLQLDDANKDLEDARNGAVETGDALMNEHDTVSKPKKKQSTRSKEQVQVYMMRARLC